MSRARLIDFAAAVVLATVGLGTLTAVVTVLPTTAVAAETKASRACMDYGILPNSTAFEQCVSRVTRAFEWGEREMAYTLARISGDAKKLCTKSGLRPTSDGFQSCMDREIEARSLLVFTDDQGPRDWPQPTTIASQ